MNSRQGIDFSW